MKFARQCLAALVLSVWLLALGHVALEHCAVMNGGCVVACQSHTGGGHEGDEHPHHHLTAFASSPLGKVLAWKMPLLWRSFDQMLAEQWSEISRASLEPRAALASWESPPDERAAGWLFVCQTARPVRGPSLAA